MFVIIGIVVVFGSVIGGYLMEHGPLEVLLQPAELLIIGGATIGIILISTPGPVLKQLLTGITGCFKGKKISKQSYMELFPMLYELFTVARREGLMRIEADIENPSSSAILSKYTTFISNHHAVEFLCDTLKMLVGGGIPPHELETLLETDLDTHHDEASKPTGSLSKVGDALPGLGIVAAVLGVVVTMQAVGGPPEEIGHKVAAALVGTFLGILLSYGLVQPICTNIEFQNSCDARYFMAIKESLLAFARGSSPLVAVEFGRRAVYSIDRPEYKELEESCRAAMKK